MQTVVSVEFGILIYFLFKGPGVDNNGSVNVELAGVQSHQV